MMDVIAFFGLGEGYSEGEVRELRKRMAKLHHPDVGGDKDLHAAINGALDYLLWRIGMK